MPETPLGIEITAGEFLVTLMLPVVPSERVYVNAADSRRALEWI